jgi:hypothetical protein
MTKRTASELWDALDEATIDAEMESVLAMTPEERRRDLVAAGYDLDKVHADADAFFASLPGKISEATALSAPAATASPAAAVAPTPPSPPAPAAAVVPTPPARRPWRMRPAIVVPTALALAAGAALTYQALSPEMVGAGRPEDPPAVHAAALRQEARDACQARSWKTCVDKLDEARVLDPGGDETPDVRALRHTAAEGVGHP